jgi:SAM-dependent methyltransferase
MALVEDKDVSKYEKRRYGGADQKLIDRRERALVVELLRAVGLERGRILDAPCGYGRFSTVLAELGAAVVCADVSAAMVGRTRAQLNGTAGARFVVMDIRQLPFRDGTFDATFTMRLFHHGFAREQMAAILRELARVSRRYVILSYYRYNALHAALRRLKGFSSRIRMMTDAELATEVAGAPLALRRRERVLPLLHAQTLAVLEKCTDPQFRGSSGDTPPNTVLSAIE